MVETTDEIDFVKEIEKLESMYHHYRKLYSRVRFLCCSSETKRLKERKKYFKSHLEEAKRTKEYSDAVKRHLRLTTPAKEYSDAVKRHLRLTTPAKHLN